MMSKEHTLTLVNSQDRSRCPLFDTLEMKDVIAAFTAPHLIPPTHTFTAHHTLVCSCRQLLGQLITLYGWSRPLTFESAFRLVLLFFRFWFCIIVAFKDSFLIQGVAFQRNWIVLGVVQSLIFWSKYYLSY